MTLSPIIVFAYNRPQHIIRTLEALAKNKLADESVLHVYCDGAKDDATEEQKAKVDATKKAVRTFRDENLKKFRDIVIREADKNKGLANSIIDGVTEVINEYGRAIVLEDDLLTSPYFLKYMNEALDFYDERKSVFSIAANRPPEDKMRIPEDYEYDVFVSERMFSTGWATWKDRWNKVNWGLGYIDSLLKDENQMEAFNRGGDDMTEMLLLQRDGKIDSWAIRFAYAHFREHAVAILPCRSYVDNIGFDGTGIHSGTENNGEHRNKTEEAPENPKFPDALYEDKRIINAFYNVYCRKRKTFAQRIAGYVKRKLLKKKDITIKRKIYV